MARFCFRTDQSSSNVTMTPTWDNSWSVRIDWSIGPRQTGSSVRSPADLKLPPHLDSPGLKKHGFLTNRGNKTGPSGRSSPEAHLLDYYLHLPEVNCWVIDADGRLTAGHTGEFIHHNTSCLLCEVAQQQHWRAEIQNLRSRTWDPEAEIQRLVSCAHVHIVIECTFVWLFQDVCTTDSCVFYISRSFCSNTKHRNSILKQ